MGLTESSKLLCNFLNTVAVIMADENAQNEPVTEPPVPATSTEEPIADGTPLKDTLMADATSEQPDSSPAPAVRGASPAPARTGTPAQGSRAASVHPDPGLSIPAEAPPHGDVTRRVSEYKGNRCSAGRGETDCKRQARGPVARS